MFKMCATFVDIMAATGFTDATGAAPITAGIVGTVMGGAITAGIVGIAGSAIAQSRAIKP